MKRRIAVVTFGLLAACAGTSENTETQGAAINVAVGSTHRLWTDTTVPTNVDIPEVGSLELGVKFRVDVAGQVTGLVFYKSSQNTGPHTGSVWSSSGQLLAQATFTNETASGWQKVVFSPPVSVRAGSTYVASYHTDRGHYSLDVGYFANRGVDSGPLHALQSGVDGQNGVYAVGPTSFPTYNYQSSNFWVDVEFSTSASDAGAPTDAGTPTDSGTLPDANTPSDGGLGCGMPETAGTRSETIVVNGVSRRYLITVPAGLDGRTRVPVLLGFHGGSDTAENASRYMGLTSTEAALYVYPQAPYWPEAGGVGWNVDPAGVDFPYFDALLADLGKKHCIDTSRVFATGKSNGAFFVNALACHRPGVLRAIAPVAGGGPNGRCTEGLPAMIIHGTTDTVVSIDSGRYSRDYWREANGCSTSSTPANPPPCVAYSGCSEPVLWCQHGGAHIWPAWAGAGVRNFFLSQ